MAELIQDNLDYGTIIGKFSHRSTDNADAGKRPQATTHVGLNIVCVPETDPDKPAIWRDLTTDDEQTFTIGQFVATTGEDGVLRTLADPTPGMEMPALTSPKIDPSGGTWRCRIWSTEGVSPVYPASEFSFTLTPGEIKDITKLTPVPPSPGSELIEWEAAVASAQAAVTEAESARAGAEAARDDAEAAAASIDASTMVRLTQLARDPEQIIVGGITRNTADAVTSASVVWPGGVPGTFTADAIDSSGAINGYHITYGNPVTKTFTQPTMTRNAQGAVTVLPQIVVT